MIRHGCERLWTRCRLAATVGRPGRQATTGIGRAIRCQYAVLEQRVRDEAFPTRSFTPENFLRHIVSGREEASVVWCLDMSDAPSGVQAVHRLVKASAAAAQANVRMELGNEVYDPRQGPQPGGFDDAHTYLEVAAPAMRAARGAGAHVRTAAAIAPCPFYGCDWGPRYSAWNANISGACAGGRCPFDAVVAHNYIATLQFVESYDTDIARLAALLMLPEVSLLHADESLRRGFPPGVRLWMTEYNLMCFAPAWDPKATGAALSWCRRVENSGAHAVFVAASVLSGLVRPSTVELMNYHSLLNTAAHLSQPGFAILSVNGTNAQVSPVAQILAHMATTIRAAPQGLAGMPDLAPAERTDPNLEVLRRNALPCIQAASACSGNGAMALVLNRCNRTIALPTLAAAAAAACASRLTPSISGAVSYSASYGIATRTWAELPLNPTPPPPWDAPLQPAYTSGRSVEGHTFSFVHVAMR